MIRIESNGHRVAARLRAVVQAINTELAGEIAVLAARVAATMRQRAPEFEKQLSNSVRAKRETPHHWFVGPHTFYAIYVEKGRKPGKGLPRFSDPRASNFVKWLEAHPAGGGFFKRPRKGSKGRVAHELELRDRYMALSRYVKRAGIRPRPFVADTAAEYREIVPAALRAAVQRALDQAGGRTA